MIDADPQHNLTTYLGLALKPNEPTLLEFLKNAVPFEDAIYPIEGWDNLFLISADKQLDAAVDYLASSGVGATLLKRRLETLAATFKFCIIDSPPQRSKICLSVRLTYRSRDPKSRRSHYSPDRISILSSTI